MGGEGKGPDSSVGCVREGMKVFVGSCCTSVLAGMVPWDITITTAILLGYLY